MTNTKTSIPTDRVVGSIYGLAYGDAIGDPTEFKKYDEIVSAGGASVPQRLRITDDTQMSLAVWYAIDAWDPTTSVGMLRLNLTAEFTAWLHDPDNNRAPGTTCLSSLHRLEKVGLGRWTNATSPTSAGCGSVMRAPWVGLHPSVRDEDVASVAMTQAVLTHGNAESWTAAAAAELTRALARDEVGLASAWLQEWALQERAYPTAALSDLWRHARRSDNAKVGHDSPESYVAEGMEHVLWAAKAAERLGDELSGNSWGFDPCTIAGEGWRARECLAVAVGILDGFLGAGHKVSPAIAVEMLQRAATTGGDSDSIGAVTGALVGASLGDVWPGEWKARLETRYRNELAAVVARLKF